MKAKIKNSEERNMTGLSFRVQSMVCLIFLAQWLITPAINAQTLDEYKQDTVWLRNGEILPCKISGTNVERKTISVTYRTKENELVADDIERVDIYRYKVSIQGEDQIIEKYEIELKDGTILTGNIISESEKTMEFYVTDLGVLSLSKDRIRMMKPLDHKGRPEKGYWFENPHATRLLFAPTAIPLRKGEGYYQNIYVVANMFNYGVLNNLSIGGGFDFISMFGTMGGEWSRILNFNVKSGFQVAEKVHAGVGGLYLVVPGEFSSGILYGIGTFGSTNSNISMGTGWGFVDNSFEKRPFIMVGGMARMSEKLWFISENWITPLGANNNYYVLLSYGLRFTGRRIAVDLAFINNKDIVEAIFIGIPFVDFVVKLGK